MPKLIVIIIFYDPSVGFSCKLIGPFKINLNWYYKESLQASTVKSELQTIGDLMEALSQYVYRSQGGVLRDRSRWFVYSTQPTLCLWWIEVGLILKLEQGKERLEHLCQHGSSPYAFSFKTTFPPPAEVRKN